MDINSSLSREFSISRYADSNSISIDQTPLSRQRSVSETEQYRFFLFIGFSYSWVVKLRLGMPISCLAYFPDFGIFVEPLMAPSSRRSSSSSPNSPHRAHQWGRRPDQLRGDNGLTFRGALKRRVIANCRGEALGETRSGATVDPRGLGRSIARSRAR